MATAPIQMDTRILVQALKEKAQALITAAKVLESGGISQISELPTPVAQRGPKRRALSPEARKRIALGQKKRRMRERQEAKNMKDASEMLPTTDVAA